VQVVFQWRYLLLGVNTQSGQLKWAWIERMRQAHLRPALEGWSADGLVWDNASAHQGQQVTALGFQRVFLPPYSPELNPAERIFEVLRQAIEGEVYASVLAKQQAVDHLLRQLAADRQRVKRRVNWDWIQAAFAALPEPDSRSP